MIGAEDQKCDRVENRVPVLRADPSVVTFRMAGIALSRRATRKNR